MNRGERRGERRKVGRRLAERLAMIGRATAPSCQPPRRMLPACSPSVYTRLLADLGRCLVSFDRLLTGFFVVSGEIPRIIFVVASRFRH